MIDPDVSDWERLRKAIPAVEKPTIDESLMQVYINLAEEEVVISEEKKQYDSVWSKDNIDDEWVNYGFEPYEFDEEDPVNSPDHYNTGNIECIDAIKESMSSIAFQGYLKGNCMKYLWRYDYKGKPVEDLQKAQWYLAKLLSVVVFEEEGE